MIVMLRHRGQLLLENLLLNILKLGIYPRHNNKAKREKHMKTIEEIYKEEKKTVRDLNEIIWHLRMEIKRLHEVINESKH